MSAPTVADRRVHPATVALRFAREAPSTVLAIPAALAFVADAGFGRALWAAAVLALLVLFFNILAWLRFRYGIGEREIVIESGLLSRNRREIPFDRIQDVDIERKLLARLFGLAKVRVETGAGGKDEGTLDSVTHAEALRLRETVRARRHGPSAEPAAAEAELAPAGETLFAMDMPRVLLFGLFNFSLVYIAGLFALLQTFDDALKAWLGFDIYDPARWVGLFGERLPNRWTPGAAAAVLFLAVVLGVGAGIARTLARDHGYRLSLEGGRFRRERGLFTRSEAVIARPRVQLGQIQTGPLRRALGWFGLTFQTLGAGADSSGHQSAAPFARREELEPVLSATGRLRLPSGALIRVSRRHVLRSIAVALAPASLAIAVVAAAWRPGWMLVFLLPLLAVRAALERHFHRYALDGDLLHVASGIWRQRLWMVPLARAQALSLSRSWLQRRLGLATLSIDTAGAPMLNFPRIVDLREETARRLMAEIADYSSGRKSGTDR